MDAGKPSIPPHHLRSHSASERPSAVVYYRNDEEVRRGFLIALSAMGLAEVEKPPELAMHPV
jgi:hypothetical protein